MIVAVNQGVAREGEHFQTCVQKLVDANLIPARALPWVDHIREVGNQAAHHIASVSKEDAVRVMDFTQTVLVLLYENPGRLSQKQE